VLSAPVARFPSAFLHPVPPSCTHISPHPRLSLALPLTPQHRSKFQVPSLAAAQFNPDLQTDLLVRCEVLFVELSRLRGRVLVLHWRQVFEA